jgi:acyl-coenzyme A synthetase/AMP-(fatty) acid ligase
MGNPDRLAYMIYTSGTSGHPRAVMHAHRAVWARRMMQTGWTGLGPADRLMHAGALPWTYTLGTGLLDPWAAGATAILPAKGVDAGHLGLLMRRHDATILAGTPGHYRQVLKASLPSLPRLRHGLSAGEQLPDTTRAAWEAVTATPVYEAFGMSECSTFLSSARGRPAPRGATGFAQPGRRIAILGTDGVPVRRNEPGTLAIDRNDPGLFLGYFGAEGETQSRYSGDWFLTGDSASMSTDGAITYLGRDDDMMNAGGVRVSPLEVEAAMAAFPGLDEVAACEIRLKPDLCVVACFYTGPEHPEAGLAAHAAAHLARYKQPRLFIRVDRIPRGPTNKILRRSLRHDWEARHGKA